MRSNMLHLEELIAAIVGNSGRGNEQPAKRDWRLPPRFDCAPDAAPTQNRARRNARLAAMKPRRRLEAGASGATLSAVGRHM